MFETLGLLETNAKLLGGSLLAMLTTAATCTCAYLNNKLDIDFNPSKTKNLDFSRKNISHPPVQFGVHGPFIQKVDNHIHLGVNLQYDGGWKQHINSIHEKACIRLNLLKLVKYKLCRCSLKKIYFSFIRPVLEYADIVWTIVQIEKLNF